MLDVGKLENVHNTGKKTIARCPVCAKNGKDKAGNHLFIHSDGRFGCVANPGKAGHEHRRQIVKLAGDRTPRTPKVNSPRTFLRPGAIQIGILGRLGRGKETHYAGKNVSGVDEKVYKEFETPVRAVRAPEFAAPPLGGAIRHSGTHPPRSQEVAAAPRISSVAPRLERPPLPDFSLEDIERLTGWYCSRPRHERLAMTRQAGGLRDAIGWEWAVCDLSAYLRAWDAAGRPPGPFPVASDAYVFCKAAAEEQMYLLPDP